MDMGDKEYNEEYIETNWHLYDEADELFKRCEALIEKLHRKMVIAHAKKCLDDLYYLRRLCDQHAG